MSSINSYLPEHKTRIKYQLLCSYFYQKPSLSIFLCIPCKACSGIVCSFSAHSLLSSVSTERVLFLCSWVETGYTTCTNGLAHAHTWIYAIVAIHQQKSKPNQPTEINPICLEDPCISSRRRCDVVLAPLSHQDFKGFLQIEMPD